LLKKILFIPYVSCTEEWEDYIDTQKPEVIKDIYGLFNVYPVSMDMEPIWWKFFDSLEELNEKLWTKFEEKDVGLFWDMRIKKDKARKAVLKKAWKN
jgi:hypothetical protein